MFILSLRSVDGGLPDDCGSHASCVAVMLSPSCDASTLLCHQRIQHLHPRLASSLELNGL